MVVAFVSPLKAFFATVFEDSLVEVILMVFNFLHPLKAFAPILVALLPNVTLVREEHPLNAFDCLQFANIVPFFNPKSNYFSYKF